MDTCQLTKSQLELYDYIAAFYHRERIWPRYRTIQDHFNWKSPNSVTRRLKALVKKGYLSKDDENGYQFTDKIPGVPGELGSSSIAEPNLVNEEWEG